MKQLLVDIYEELEYCFVKFKEDVKLLGFWKTLWYDIQNAWHHNIGWIIRKIIKIIKWIPVLWHDEDWENTYILKMLRFKLLRVRKEINGGYGDDKEWKEPRSAEIDSVIECIDKILADEFAKMEWEEHRERYGHIGFDTAPSSESERLSRMIFYYEKVKNDAEKDKIAHEESFKISNLEDERRQKEYDKLFALLAKHIQGWWD